MTTLELTNSAQQVINFELNAIKFAVRRNYRQASQFDKLNGAWLNTLSPKVDSKIKDIWKLADGQYSYLNIAVAAMKGTKIKAKLF